MNKLELAINRAKTLPQAEQDFLAAWLLAHDADDEIYELSDSEIAELKRRMASDEPTYTAQEVFEKITAKLTPGT